MTKEGNMYRDAIVWNCFVGCRGFNCSYCDKSFKAQMKRQKPMIDKNGRKRGCQQCYDYEPHFHPERITHEYMKKHFAKAKEDQFIWCGSSGDISFIEDDNMEKILEKIKKYPQTFFFQSKDPSWFDKWDFPKNTMIGITLESDVHYPKITNAPAPWKRATDFYFVEHPRKVITVEPVLQFDFNRFYGWFRDIRPERVYIGFDSKANKLPEPKLKKVENFIIELERLGIKIKTKLMRKAWNEEIKKIDLLSKWK